jgi:hypothetical protein
MCLRLCFPRRPNRRRFLRRDEVIGEERRRLAAGLPAGPGRS